jgi:hypothetical protein
MSPAQKPERWMLVLLLVLPVILSIAAFWAFDRDSAQNSLFDLSNLVGPTAASLSHGGGLTVCTEAMGTPGNPICFHAGRMPMASMIVALGERLFGNRFLPVAAFKLVLFLLPIEGALYLVWCRLPRSRLRQALIVLLLLVPFGMTPLLADVVNLQVEEGYSYSFLALALAILFFWMRTPANPMLPGPGFLGTVLFAISVDAIYLAKSAMAPATLVLTIAFILRERRTALRILVLLLVAAAPLGWAMHQHHASGRYAFGTSVDGINLHKGNNEAFLERYPPPAGDSMDRFDSELNRGLHFSDEWSFNDYHQRAALTYLRTHPKRTLQAGLYKLDVIFIAIRKSGSAESHGLMLLVETGGFLLFRVLLWIAIICSIVGILRSHPERYSVRPTWISDGFIFLALIAACALPYILGFAYSRHVSILIYPAVLMCCAMLMDRDGPRVDDEQLPA